MQNSFYALQLEDYALPGFVSGGKYYYGNVDNLSDFFGALKSKVSEEYYFKETLLAYDEFKNGNLQAKHSVGYTSCLLLEPVKLHAFHENYRICEIEWEHTNIHGFPYCMKADFVDNDIVWIQHGNLFARCAKSCFANLSYCDGLRKKDYVLINNNFWGHPAMLCQYKSSDGKILTKSRLFMKEKVFENKEEMMKDIESFSGVCDYSEFCNDIFADG